jgi:hypothetical protein
MARALRKLSPDSALFRRRARGESLRNLARDYDVEHTSLSRYFRTEQGARRLRQAEQELEAKRAQRELPPPLEPDPEPPRSTRSDPRAVPEFASQAERLAHYERHRLDSVQALLDSNDARAGRETPRERRAREAATKSVSPRGRA